MSGSKRKSSYRKGVSSNYDQIDPDIVDGDCIVRILANRGSNQFDIQFPNTLGSKICILPNRFRNLIWIKRNDFVVVSSTSSSADDPDCNFEIKHILNKDNIKHLKSIGKWPPDFLNLNENVPNDTQDDLMPGYSPHEEIDPSYEISENTLET